MSESETKFLKCSCQRCGGHIEYPAHAAGTTADCPHCHWQTDLIVEVPELTATRPRGGLKWMVLGGFLLLAALGIAAPMLLKRAVVRTNRNPPKPVVASAPIARPVQNGFEIGPVFIEPAASGSLTHASGTLRNTLDRQRFSVRIEVECLDADGRVVTTTSDYRATIEPNAEWRFRALIRKGKPASARITYVTEQQ
ncbi:MAG TPA: FxLYD domain-containing protein [Candidatus Acidoferrum sp.]|nr:FxLYD domain-containing protein [Candidatus Acidoferrum sp.]